MSIPPPTAARQLDAGGRCEGTRLPVSQAKMALLPKRMHISKSPSGGWKLDIQGKGQERGLERRQISIKSLSRSAHGSTLTHVGIDQSSNLR